MGTAAWTDADTIARLEKENKRLRGAVSGLRDALRPFAAAVEGDDTTPDNFEPEGVTFRECRSALSAWRAYRP